MEKLNNDEIFYIAIFLDVPELLSFCKLSRKINTVCKKDDIWLYKLKKEFPNYKEIKTDLSYKDLYIDMKKYSIPSDYDRNKSYNILDLYKAVEKGYNTKFEFEQFARKPNIYNLIVNKHGESLSEFLMSVEDILGSYKPLNNGSIVIYFSYPNRKVKYGYSDQYYRPENFGLWSK